MQRKFFFLTEAMSNSILSLQLKSILRNRNLSVNVTTCCSKNNWAFTARCLPITAQQVFLTLYTRRTVQLLPMISNGCFMHTTVVTCKIKLFQNIRKDVLVFYFSCNCLLSSHVFNMLKYFVLQHFCTCVSIKHLRNILEVVTCKNNTLKHFCKCFIWHLTTV